MILRIISIFCHQIKTLSLFFSAVMQVTKVSVAITICALTTVLTGVGALLRTTNNNASK